MPDIIQGLAIAKGEQEIQLLPRMANRHGLIAGATGTGKTVTLRVLAENFSRIGVPIFMADVKGDLSGLGKPGGDNPKIIERARDLGLADIRFEGYPVTFWDVYGEQGNPVRTTISDMGPLLLARILSLNDIQSDVLSILFKIADDNSLLLLDMKDLRSMCEYVSNNLKDLKIQYGNISPASIGAIQRSLITLEDQGGNKFFGEPVLAIEDLMVTDGAGRGMINILAADRLLQTPRLYSTFLLWLLSELFERLPEIGDPQKPKLVFFFDEAHLLFQDTPKVIEEKIVQVVRLIRSKGVGVYFITHYPLDLPDAVLGQLGNRVQHALRAFTPKDQKDVKAAAQTMRQNPKFNTLQAITDLKIGEALVSLLDDNGSPSVVDRALIYPPLSRLAPLSQDERSQIFHTLPSYAKYASGVDRESAYEILKRRAESLSTVVKQPPAQKTKSQNAKSGKGSVFQVAAKGAAIAIGSQIGRELMRGMLGSLSGTRKK